jgi:hemoglobin-like flavoprotein
MLEQDPQKRWTSMPELKTALQQLASGIVPTSVRKCVADSYNNKLHNNREFFDLFYKSLFRSSDEICAIFNQRNVTMDMQYSKLDHAMRYLFHFDPDIQPTTLDDQVERHSGLGIRMEHFGLFKVAFLEALRKMGTDTYWLDAWSAVLDPALRFMRERTCG